jgi:hypothetical protein
VYTDYSSTGAAPDREVIVIDLNESLRKAAAYSKQRILIQLDITKKIWTNAFTDFWPRWKTNATNVSTHYDQSMVFDMLHLVDIQQCCDLQC